MIKEELTLHGNRVAILRSKAEDTIKYGNLEIVKHEKFIQLPRSGNIVAFGTECDLFEQGLDYGDVISFNKYNSITFELTDIEGFEQPVSIDVLHASDIYLSWKDK